MTLLTVEGIYKDEKVELSEQPKLAEETARVLVTFLSSSISEAEGAVDRERLRGLAFARLREGLHLGGAPYPTREELHERSR